MVPKLSVWGVVRGHARSGWICKSNDFKPSLSPAMVRARASDRNLEIATALSKALTAEFNGKENQDRFRWVYCQGDRSLYAAFASLLPSLARVQVSEQRPINRRGVSVFELNKALQRLGMESVRTQKRPNSLQVEASPRTQGPSIRLKVTELNIFAKNPSQL